MDKAKANKGKIIKKIIIVILVLFIIPAVCIAIAGVVIYNRFGANLPDVEYLRKYKPSLITQIYSDDGELIGKYFVENRILVPIEKIPSILKQATIAVEDSRFFTHFGIDPEGVLRAMVTNLSEGRVVEGGSTITQQLAKTLFLSPKKSIERKIKEAILARRIEKKFSKNEILEFYLNQIYYGHGAYGVEAAANTYFNKHIEEISLGEAALIAGLPRAPSNYSPFKSITKAKTRQSHVLRRMAAMGFITRNKADRLIKEPIVLARKDKITSKAPYFTEYIRKYLEKKYGATDLYRSGMKVETTLNMRLQKAAQQAITDGIQKAGKRAGYSGPISHLEISESTIIDWEAIRRIENSIKKGKIFSKKEGSLDIKAGIVTDVKKKSVTVKLDEDQKGVIPLKSMSWARKPNPKIDGRYRKIRDARKVLKTGDIVLVKVIENAAEEKGSDLSLELYQENEIQGALISIEPQTGYIRAMVGGSNFYKSQFNRAIQAVRQPGSAFKPITYSAALQKGFTPASIFIDSPITYKESKFSSFQWKPENFEERFYGPTTLRKAITHSRNIVTVKLMQKLGIQYVIDFARKLGIKTPLTADLSLALGSSGVTLIELTTAYSVFANNGFKVTPFAIKEIRDRNGNIIKENHQERIPAIKPEIAYIITEMLKDVVEHGTGRKAKLLGRPTAAKTGTTNDFVDAWFVGYTTNLSTGVWVGYDKEKTLGKNETGSRAASPIWLQYMKEAVKGTPIDDFSIPPNIIFSKIDPETGLLAQIDNKDAYFEIFIDGTQPTEYSKKEETEAEKFLLMDMEDEL